MSESERDTTPDIVQVILERVSALVPEDQRQALEEVEQQVREEYAGVRFRVSRSNRAKRRALRDAVLQDALTAAPDEAIQKKHGISRATLYRMVKGGPTRK